MPTGSSRPPLTEAAGMAVAKDIKGPAVTSHPAETPLAFQTPKTHQNPAPSIPKFVTGLQAIVQWMSRLGNPRR